MSHTFEIDHHLIYKSLTIMDRMNGATFVLGEDKSEFAFKDAEAMALATGKYTLAQLTGLNPYASRSELEYYQPDVEARYKQYSLTLPSQILYHDAVQYAAVLSTLMVTDWETFFKANQKSVLALGAQLQNFNLVGIVASLPADYLQAVTIHQRAGEGFPGATPISIAKNNSSAMISEEVGSPLYGKHSIYIYSATPDYPDKRSETIYNAVQQTYPDKNIISPRMKPPRSKNNK